MLEVKGLTKEIDGRTIIDDVSFTLPRGTIAGLVGRNGAGKTTLLRCMVGILLPEAGDVHCGGKSIFTHPEVKADIVFVPDGPSPHQNSTVDQLASLYELIYPDFDRDALARWLDQMALPRRQPIRSFSKGMHRLLTLALAFATRAGTVMLDEPVDGLDPIAKRQCLQLIVDEVAHRQVAVMISSHRLEELEAICDHVLMLANGTLESTADLVDIQQQYCKFQVVYEDTGVPDELLAPGHVHLLSQSGRIVTILVEGDAEAAAAHVENTKPLLVDRLPLQLEDLFVAKLGGDVRVP